MQQAVPLLFAPRRPEEPLVPTFVFRRPGAASAFSAAFGEAAGIPVVDAVAELLSLGVVDRPRPSSLQASGFYACGRRAMILHQCSACCRSEDLFEEEAAAE